MDVPDSLLFRNRDWDPSYLAELVSQDFFDFSELWSTNYADSQLVSDVQQLEKYQRIVEDISLDDNVLCTAVEAIEKE